MQVPNVLNSLRAKEKPSYEAPVEWTDWTAVWEDEVELYARLREIYTSSLAPQDAMHWAAYVDNRRPIDWQFCLEFFMECPDQYKTATQLEVSSNVRSADTKMAAMQLLYQYYTEQPAFDNMLLTKGTMEHLEIDLLSSICQDVWESSARSLLVKPLPERITEFFKKHPHAIDTNELPQNGVGLLIATMLIGVDNPSYAINIGEDKKYYNDACKNATDTDILKILACHQKNPEWRKRMKTEFGMQWYEPFMQAENPHHLSFGIYQSLDPSMNIKQFAHFIEQQSQAPAESYSLESIALY